MSFMLALSVVNKDLSSRPRPRTLRQNTFNDCFRLRVATCERT